MGTNCWEFKKCGRQKGGPLASELGVCPAHSEMKLNGIHGGNNAGRACWAVAGTFCKGEKQGSFVSKIGSCTACDFFNVVKTEEGSGLLQTGNILRKMR